MALQKRQIALDLVRGADTKTNDQISENFKDMENVVFTGNLTAKKMNGYDGLSMLPAGNNYSIIARRKNDLIAVSDNGTYKYMPNNGEFQKISKLGISTVESNECRGKLFGMSDNYYCTFEMVSYDSSITPRSKISFFTKDNTLINTLNLNITDDLTSKYNYEVYKLSKIINIGDDFYICSVDYSLGIIVISKFKLNTSTNQFEYVSTNSSVNLGVMVLTGIDFIAHGNYIVCVFSNGTVAKISRFDTTTPSVAPVETSLTNIPKTNVELFYRDATTIYMSYGVVSGVVLQHKLTIITVSTNTETSTANLGTYSKVSNGIVDNYPYIYCYPLSDSTAVTKSFVDPNNFVVGTGISAIILSPLSKIFKQDNSYYIACFFYNFAQIANVVMRFDNVQVNGSYDSLVISAISDSGIVEYQSLQYVQQSYAFNCLNETCLDDGFNYFTGFTAEGYTTLIKFKNNAKQTSNYIEIESSNIIGGSVPLYFDGETCTEFGFIGVPQITAYSTAATGSLPADSGYMFMAQFEWTDALGNVFHSQYSQIYSGGNPTSGITLPGSSRVTLVVQAGILTGKQNVKLKVYIKRSTRNTFQLVETKYIQAYDYFTSYTYNITTYPATDAEEAVYQDDSIQPLMVTNYGSLSLYSDRIINTTKDFPMAINYSHKKEFGQAFEFNDSVFTLDVLDKRGIAEDLIVTTIAMDGRLLILKERSILYINGSGPARTNLNNDFSEPQLITTDAGCTQARSVVLTPDGVMFKSDKGIYLLDRYLKVDYIGTGVERFNENTITSAILLEKINEVRFTTLEGEVLVYNYFSKAWSWFTDLPCLSACIWKDKYTMLLTDGQILTESQLHKKILIDGVHTAIVQKISTPWLRMNGKQAWQKAYDFLILGFYKSKHKLKLSVYYDYELYANDVIEINPLDASQYNITTKPSDADLEKYIIANGVYQATLDLVRKSCQAVRIEIEDIPEDIENNTGEGFEISNITATVGVKSGPAKQPAYKSY